MTQLFGVLLMSAALILLMRRFCAGPSAGWAALGTTGVIAGLATTAAALQAVDGVALKVLVDAWATAPASAKLLFLQTAFAVRQIEIGLASVTSLLFGLTVCSC